MLKSPFKFLGFNGRTKTRTSNPPNDRRTTRKLRKIRHPANITVGTASQPSPKERELDTSTVVSKRKESGKNYQNQPADPLLVDQETAAGPPVIHSTHTASPQAHETNHLSSSRDFPEGGKKPSVQAPISGDPNPLWTSIPTVHRGSFGSSLAHEWSGDHGGLHNRISSGPHHIPKRLMTPETFTRNVGPHQYGDAQEQHEAENDNLKNASQQQNIGIHNPIVTRENPLEEGENRARRENVRQRDHRETSKVDGDRVKNSFEPEIYYYIVPPDLDIIFQDEDGTEITRVGKGIKGTQVHSSDTHTKNIPFVVQDIFGNEIFR